MKTVTHLFGAFGKSTRAGFYVKTIEPSWAGSTELTGWALPTFAVKVLPQLSQRYSLGWTNHKNRLVEQKQRVCGDCGLQ